MTASSPPLSKPARRLSLIDPVLVLGLAILVSAFSVPGLFAGVAAVALFAAIRFAAGRLAFVLVCVSLAFCLGAAETVLRFGAANPSYYRPDEVLAQFAPPPGRSHYQPNRRLDFAMPYGDLFVLSGRTARDIVEPRTVTFITDTLGYRDRTGPAERRYVLVGDSFAVGSGTTQERILSETLGREHGIDIYAAAFPGGPEDYARTVQWLKANTALVRERNVVALLFEGNDFLCPENAPPPATIWEWRWRPVTRLETYRLFYGLTRVAFGSGELNRSVLVREVGGRAMGFLQLYVQTTKRAQACDWSGIAAALEAMRPNLALVAFAPTKFRIYGDLAEPGVELPNTQWQFLERTAAALGVPALNLTPALCRRAAELLAEGRYVYWRDDSHWNGDGMDAAAEAIAQALKR